MDWMTSFAVWSGIIIASLFAFREFHLANRLASVILIATLVSLGAIGICSGGIFFLFFGASYLGFYIGLPACVTFGIIKAARYFQALPPPRCGKIFREFRFAVFCGFGLGFIYLLYAVGLLVVSQNVGSGSVVEESAVNFPILWLMVMFGVGRTLDTTQTSPLEIGLVFILAGTVFYSALGTGIGFIADLSKVKNRT